MPSTPEVRAIRARTRALAKLRTQRPKEEYVRAKTQYGPKVSPWRLGPAIKNRKP